jgi:predicted MFS family arabinose efflux permease
VIIYLVRALVVAGFLLLPMSLASVLIFSAVMGFFWLSTVPPTSELVAVMFGTRYMALLYGIVFLGHQIGSFCGVWLGGVLYEQTGSHDLVRWLSALLALLAAVVHWPIREQVVVRLQTV